MNVDFTRYYKLILGLVLFNGTLLNACYGQPRFFWLTDDPIDVVIPAVDPGLVDYCIDSIRKYGTRIRDVYVVSPTKVSDKAIWIDEASFPFNIKSVANHLFQDEAKVATYFRNHGKGRVGWYLQQLLKLYAPLIIPDISPNVLVLDSDVVFLQPVQFLTDKNEPLFCPGEEEHWLYFVHAKKLLPGFSRYFKKARWGSGIAHHMLMQRDPIIQLVELIESIHGIPAWQAMCHCVDIEGDDLPVSGFSEYEIYFNFFFASGSQGHIRYLLWKNAGGDFNWWTTETLLAGINEFRENGYNYIACHW